MKNIAIIGTQASIIGFRFLGIDTFVSTDKKEAMNILNELRLNYSVIFIEESFYEQPRRADENLQNKKVSAAIIPLPLKGKSEGVQFKKMNDIIKKAIGISQI